MALFQIGGITIEVNADLPLTNTTFSENIYKFSADDPGEDMIVINHHFYLPDFHASDLGNVIYFTPPWKIFRNSNIWTYCGIFSKSFVIYKYAAFNNDYSYGDIYNSNPEIFLSSRPNALTLFPSDQILLAQVLSDRSGCYIHASGMIINGQGVLFVGHSSAGKSTISKMLMADAELLCDDRIILRQQKDGFRIYGTWSHGELPFVSPNNAPLAALFFLEKAKTNRIIPLSPSEVVRMLPFYIIKPLITADWWKKIFLVIENIAKTIPAYQLQFDKSGAIRDLIHNCIG